MSFEFDTSGHVNLGKAAFPFHNEYVEWSDLTPFVMGYVEALKQSHYALQLPPAMKPEDDPEGDISLDWEFSDLDPSALALILRDCEAYTEGDFWKDLEAEASRTEGANLWRDRQAGMMQRFPPLQPYLSDEGRVCLREAP